MLLERKECLKGLLFQFEKKAFFLHAREHSREFAYLLLAAREFERDHVITGCASGVGSVAAKSAPASSAPAATI